MEEIEKKIKEFVSKVESGKSPETVSREMGLGPSNVVLRILRKQLGNEVFTEWLHEFVMPLKFKEWLDVYVDHVNTVSKLDKIKAVFDDFVDRKNGELNG